MWNTDLNILYFNKVFVTQRQRNASCVYVSYLAAGVVVIWRPPSNINVHLCRNNDIILIFALKNDVWHTLSKCMDSHKPKTNFLSRWLSLLSFHKCWDANLSSSAVTTQSCTRFKYILAECEEGFCGKWYHYYKEGCEAFRVLKKKWYY